MGKSWRVVVCGQTLTGKTAIIEQLIYGNHIVGAPTFKTIEDIYVAYVDTDRGVKEKVRLYDTPGLDSSQVDMPRHYITNADGFVLVYDVNSFDSFNCINKLKKDIDKHKEKKEVTVIALGNKIDVDSGLRQVDQQTAQKWAQKEKVKLYEVTASNRVSLTDGFVWLTSRMTQPPAKSSFPLVGRKSRSSVIVDN
ncbi:NF-kappa-B inhibitor-interacting Ras-like protein 1 [Lingula anatina]|uniref:NF-kappa-B inhibitor-interacting Ras-like protein 1 n=1 Tax=Lingula anatina TaxID=7574 RepID=A0A1S3IHW3_LINAN|nr:NF-kappa-B inhibitor-interacting Ras-like protein 1 [Lingula anatina]|eukprot:XP_013397471.1 NF-kappa-B inhibitor-interacting Ras-like protein 1 [Lingula anatina]